MITATQRYEQSLMADRRRREAEAISYAIFSEIEDLIPAGLRGEFHQRIFGTIHRNGVLLVRDDEREKLGLEPCDGKGWTASERLQLKKLRMEALLEAQQFVVKLKE